ncbi:MULTISPECIES: DUF4352 domain-containing protein [Halorussus]|uniref:DUF4352 domain-containing protein n=1 Tax=Halorussus TaxID=1070314 RepID=UPI000E210AE9|nr:MULTISPECIES: DUF4352 domain-containing protein [Halorussus]NHN59066.1 DUF4352 domain-containing protein [Halorussus sp. JP-T4]
MADYPATLSRRQFVGGTAVLATGLAGCSGSDDDSPDTVDTGNEDTTTQRESGSEIDPTTTENATTEGEAAFTVTGIEAPSEVPLGDSYSFSITIENTGGASGVWADTVYAKQGDGQWQEIGVIELEVPAGETKTWESNEVTVQYNGQITFRLERTAREFAVRYVSAVLPFGEPFTAANGIAFTVDKVSFMDSYTWSGSSGTQYTEEAPSGRKWAKVSVRAENKGNEQTYTPLSSDVALIAGNQQYDAAMLMTDENEFEGGEISPGIVRKGWIAYEVPEGTSKSDFKVQWAESGFDGSWSVYWSISA